MPTEEEMLRGLSRLEEHGNRVDYVLTHEPSGKSSGYLPRATRLDGVNIYLNQIEEKVTFRRWFFGSLHLDKPMSMRHTALFRDVVPVREEKKDNRKGRHFRE